MRHVSTGPPEEIPPKKKKVGKEDLGHVKVLYAVWSALLQCVSNRAARLPVILCKAKSTSGSSGELWVDHRLGVPHLT